MKIKAIAAAAGIAMAPGLLSYALAGWQDNVPHDFVPQSHHRMRQYHEPSAAPRTTGSVKYAPRRPVTRQSAQPSRNY